MMAPERRDRAARARLRRRSGWGPKSDPMPLTVSLMADNVSGVTIEERAVHPLDPISPAEIREAAKIARADERFDARMRFALAMLIEPSRSQLAESARPSRNVEVVLLDGPRGTSHRLVVSLDTERILSWDDLGPLQPPIIEEEFFAMEEDVKAHPEVRAALARRGLTPEQCEAITVDPFSAGNYGAPIESERRISRGLLYLRTQPEDNSYAHPMEGLVVTYDFHAREVVSVEDDEVFPVPANDGNYAAEFQDSFRSDLKPLEITQPEGPSFLIDGWRVEWQKWSFRVGFNQREGLTLHEIAYDDDGVQRPILARASVAEMTVPYSGVSFTQRRKAAFDVGEYGIGALANSLELGCDCLGEIHYFGSCVVGPDGEPILKPNVICMHEEDVGVLWKHYDFRTEKVDVRRSRRLVVSFFCTVGNYEYGFYWYFQQDGTIELEVKATGIVQTGVVHDGEKPEFGTMLDDNLYAPHHQHFFCIRLDAQVDGDNNRVTEVETVADPMGPTNPLGNAFRIEHRTLRSEKEARRRIRNETARSWLIESSDTRNRLGNRPAYKIVAGENCVPYMDPESPVARRAGYLQHHLWVTPYHVDERFPAGEFPNQHPGGEGLPAWVEADRDIVDRELVVWYVLGHHHIVRPEDWPVMPAAHMGLMLKPNGFFARNPALDVPPPAAHGCHAAGSAD